MQTTVIDFNVNDRLGAVDAFLERLQNVLVADSEPRAIDLSRCGYLGPDGASILAAVMLHARAGGKVVQVTPPEGKKELRSFWTFSGLEHLATKGDCEATVDNVEATVISIRQYKAARFQDADPIIRLVHRHTDLSIDAEEYLRTCVNEVIQNVQDHSQSPIGCVLSARFMNQSGEVRVAIVDRGIGIRASLSSRYPDTTTPELALQRVTTGHFSAMSRPNNMGLGISNLCGIIQSLGGEIFIVSDKAVADKQRNRQWLIRSQKYKFDGTGVFFTLPVHGEK